MHYLRVLFVVVLTPQLSSLPGASVHARFPTRSPPRPAAPLLWEVRPEREVGRLRLRGGLWYEPGEEADEEEWDSDEDDEGSYYTTTEEGDAFDHQAAGGILAQAGMGQTFQLPDGREVQAPAEVPQRMGEGMTLEQAELDQTFAPLGTFSGGDDLVLADTILPQMRSSWVDGRVPPEECVPLRLYDVYGLQDYVKLVDEDNAERGRAFDPAIDTPNEKPRNLLKIPAHELPDFFHMPCGGDELGGTNYMTLAARFGNWTGPAPGFFSGYVHTPKGRILVHSFPAPTFEDEIEDLLNVTDDFGLALIASREALAFFERATARNLARGAVVPDYHDDTIEAGPVCWAEDVMCGLSSMTLAQVCCGARSSLPELTIPSSAHPLVFEALESSTGQSRLVCRPGVWIWGRGSEIYPKWAIDVCQQDVALHLRGSLVKSCPASAGAEEEEWGGVDEESWGDARLQEDTMEAKVAQVETGITVPGETMGERRADGHESHCRCQFCKMPWKAAGEDDNDEDEEMSEAVEGELEADVSELGEEQQQHDAEREHEEAAENALWMGGDSCEGGAGLRVPSQGSTRWWGKRAWRSLGSELHGQWRVSNCSYGSLQLLRLRYNSSSPQVIFDVNSGPWLLERCDVRGGNVICVEVSGEGEMEARDCYFGGTGTELDKLPCRPGVAHIAVNAMMNGAVTLRRCILQDAGLRDGGGVQAAQSSTVKLQQCVLRRCGIAIYMAHFAHVHVRGCLVTGHRHAALFSECYQEMPDAVAAETRNATEYVPDIDFPHSPSDRLRRAGMEGGEDSAQAAAAAGREWLPFGLPEEGAGRCGSLWLSCSRVDGEIWHTDSRPWRYYCDSPAFH